MLRNKNPMSPEKVTDRTSSGSVDDAVKVLAAIRGTIATLLYLSRQNTPNVNGNLAHIANNIRAQWLHSQTLYNTANPSAQTSVAQFWSEWIKDIFGTPFVTKYRDWCQATITELRKYWGVRTDDDSQEILDGLSSLEAHLSTLAIDTTGII
jgi:hypothetical protein